MRNQDNDLNESGVLHGIDFAALISHTESYQESPETWHGFTLQVPKKLYSDKLDEQHDENGLLHDSRFEENSLAAVLDLQEQNKSKEVILGFMKDIAPPLKT